MNRIFINEHSEEILVRERIEEVYKNAMAYDIVAVIAGEGYGKTQSVLSFVSELEVNVVWVPLAVLDNYTAHFWENFCNALDGVDKELYSQMSDMGFPGNASAMHYAANFMKSFIERSGSVILVFDDCHIIKEKAICDFILTLSGMIVDDITIFLLSRPEAVINRPRSLRAKSVITIPEETLIFTIEEMQDYFNMMNLPLASVIIQEIYEKTEGWPVAVYLSALYLAENPRDTVSALQITGNMLPDIIEREIFSLYDPEQKHFLIKMSLLDFIPVRYIQDVYNPEKLHLLSKSLLFRYNKHSYSYQSHQLFKEFLRQQVSLLTKEEVSHTYRISAEWFLNNGMKIDAMHCYEQLRDRDGMWKIIWDELTGTKAPSKELVLYMMQIINSYFEDSGFNSELVLLARGAFYSLLAEYAAAEKCYDQIVQSKLYLTDEPAKRRIVGEALINQGLLKMLHGNPQFQYDFANARKFIPEGSEILPAGHMILLNGDCITLSSGKKGELSSWIEALKNSASDTDHILHNNMHGMYEAAVAQAAYYQGHFDQAEQFARTALYMAQETETVDIVGYAYYILLKTAMFKGDFDSSRKYMTSASQYTKKHNKNLIYNFTDISEGYYYTQIGQNEQVKDWILNESKYNESLMLSNYGLERILKAHYLLKRELYSELFPYLERTKKIYLNGNRFIGLIYIELIYCFGYYQTDQKQKAVEAFYRVYEMTYPNQLIMPIVEMGRLVRNIVPFLLEHAPDLPAAWLKMLRTKATTFRKRIQIVRVGYEQDSGMHIPNEKLTLREKEMLRNIAHGLTREEVSVEMGLSINTIKTMSRVVFAKLGAINSSHAVYLAIKDQII